MSFKKILVSFVLAFAVLLLLYFPWLQGSGLPTEALPKQWGYAVASNFWFLVNDPTLLVFGLMALVLLLGLLFFRKMEKKHQWLWLGLALLVVLQLLVSFRANILLALVFGLLVIDWSFKQWPHFFSFFTPFRIALFLSLIILSAAVINISRESSVVFSSSDFAPFVFLKQSTEPSSVILADPFLGHAVAFFSQRKTVADLYVEFAPEQQLRDAYRFLLEKDFSVLKTYDVAFVLTFSNGVYADVWTFKEFRTDERFGELNKVFATQKYHIYAVPFFLKAA